MRRSILNHSFAIAFCCVALCQFILVKDAGAATAHCWARIQDTAGHVIVDLGAVAEYNATFPQNPAHQQQCVQDASAAATAYLNDKGKMCHTFLVASSADLIIYCHVGTHGWGDSGHATSASSWGYPNACFNLSGQVFPSYYIFTLIYTPPGCTPAANGYQCDTNFVSYASGSTAGSTVSVEKSIGVSTELTATIAEQNLGGSYSETGTSGSDLTISKATNNTIQWPGSGQVGPDGINHDYDQFFLLMNPLVAMKGWHDPVTNQNHAQWSLGTKNGAPARIQRVQVSYLRCALAGTGPRPGGAGNGGGPAIYDPAGTCTANPNLLMQGPADASSATGWLPGLTYDDYKQILAQDLFWNASPTHHILIPTDRFAQQSVDFTYDAAGGAQGTSCAVETQSITNSQTSTTSSSTEKEYQATLEIGGNVSDALGLKSKTTFTWTNKRSASLTKENSQTASATVGCTSSSWPGPFYVSTYYDTLFGTFLFALDDGSGYARLMQGSVTGPNGEHVPHVPVKLLVNGKTYQSFSRNDGSFLLHLPTGVSAAGAGSGTLTVGSGTTAVSKTLPVGPQATTTVVVTVPPPVLSLSLGRGIPTSPSPSTLPNASSARVMAEPVPVTVPMVLNVKNVSPFQTAKNVTVTAITAKTTGGSSIRYTGTLPAVPAGGASLPAGHSATLALTFENSAVPAYLSVTVKADGLAPFTKILLQPAVLNNNTNSPH